MNNRNRDEFTESTKNLLAKQAGWLCSDPQCRRHTVGSNSAGNDVIVVGVAAHIRAAAPGGPRYDPSMSRDERRSVDNGIWLCQIHARAVDSNDPQFTVKLLHAWKRKAQRDSRQRVVRGTPAPGGAFQEEFEQELQARLRAGAIQDLEGFRRSAAWPPNAVARRFRIEDEQEQITTSAAAAALLTVDNLIVVAEPGMGKTTMVFQIAEAALENGQRSPIVVPLGEWSAGGLPLVETILRRASFGDISERQFRAVAANPGLTLLLDGWNEIDTAFRKRAIAELRQLQRELPNLGLLIATRRQAIDVPVKGTHVTLEPLGETEQLALAKAAHGIAGERLLDEAWRTAGVRELVRIPLYLDALLKLPAGEEAPTTKEEVLRRLVAAHEEDHQIAEALLRASEGLHERYLTDLAAVATYSALTTVPEALARRSVLRTGRTLLEEEQIAAMPEPRTILELLVDHHQLVHAGDPPTFSFQHQQIREWYASRYVEQLMLISVDDCGALEDLKREVLDRYPWEEAILFAFERLARGREADQAVCAPAILAAFEVDPMLAAEMIHRSTDEVWKQVSRTILDLVARWHIPGKVDRAVRFMIASGRDEFCHQVWALIAHDEGQIRLATLHAGIGRRTSTLGRGASERIRALAPEARRDVLCCVAYDGDIDGLDLVATVAKSEPDAEVKAAAIEALAFRDAGRHVAEALQDADNEIFDLLAKNGQIDHTRNEHVQERLAAARERSRTYAMTPQKRISEFLYGPDAKGDEEELTNAVATIEIEGGTGRLTSWIHEVKERFPGAVANGMLRRVLEDRELPYHIIELMAGVGFALEDEAILELVLNENTHNHRAEAAASVLGPDAVGYLIDQMLTLVEQIQEGEWGDRALVARRQDLQRRIEHSQTTHLLAAIKARSEHASSRQISGLAGLVRGHRQRIDADGQGIDANAHAQIAELVEEWGNRLLGSIDATREQLASVAALAKYAPSPKLLPVLKRLLDEELRRWRVVQAQAQATEYRPGHTTNEARIRWCHWHQASFLAIGGPETAALMEQYLLDEEFGGSAASVLAGQWRAANEPEDRRWWRSHPDFSLVAEKRAAREVHPEPSSAEADAIFYTVERLIHTDPTDEEKKQAVALATVAAALPHGERNETLSTLVPMANVLARRSLLIQLVLSGQTIDVEWVKTGIADLRASAHRIKLALAGQLPRRDILRSEIAGLQENDELPRWVSLLPFTNAPSETIEVLYEQPEQHCTPKALEPLLSALTYAPGEEAESVLFRIAEADPRLYAERAWHEAVCGRGTLSAATQLIQLLATGVLGGGYQGSQRDMVMRLSRLVDEHPELRRFTSQTLQTEPLPAGLTVLAQVLAENPDQECLMTLIQLEMKHHRMFASYRTVQSAVIEQVPSRARRGSFELVPVPAIELRRHLLAMTTDGGPNDVAARYLCAIDSIREDYGVADAEPRHPDISSGQQWPMMPSRAQPARASLPRNHAR